MIYFKNRIVLLSIKLVHKFNLQKEIQIKKVISNLVIILKSIKKAKYNKNHNILINNNQCNRLSRISK